MYVHMTFKNILFSKLYVILHFLRYDKVQTILHSVSLKGGQTIL